MKLLLLGGSGQLGGAMSAAWAGRHELIAPSRAQLDAADERSVEEWVSRAKPDALVNAASYNDVERAEDEPLPALAANALAVSILAEAAERHDAVLVHFSSDFVFDGALDRPYAEDDAPNPLSVYGASKLLGERAALLARRRYVVRVESLFGGPRPKSTVDRLALALHDRETVDGFVDRSVSPTPVHELVDAVERMLLQPVPFGLYHAASQGFTTWFELASEIARLLGREGLVRPVRVVERPLRAPRPRFSPLSAAKLERYGISFSPWREALAREMASRFAAPQ